MGFVQRLVVATVRPVYRLFVERPLWWFLSRVKAYYFAEINVQLATMGNKLNDIERKLAESERLRSAESSNAAQWDAMEQLLLALFRQSVVKETYAEAPPVANALPAPEVNRVNEASYIR